MQTESLNKKNEVSDLELVKSAKKDNRLAFNKLVLRYKDIVLTLCYRFLHNEADADDCAQEVFIKVFNSIKKFKGEAAFSTWLYRVTVNTCKNKIVFLQRKNKREIAMSSNIRYHAEEQDYFETIKDNSICMIKTLEKKEKEKFLQSKIAALPQDCKIVLILRDIEGHMYEEIADILQLPLGTVKSRLARARNLLKEELNPKFAKEVLI